MTRRGGIVRARHALTLAIVALVIVGAAMSRPVADRNATILRPVAPPAQIERRR